MSTATVYELSDRATLERFATAMAVPVTIAAEDWNCITYQTRRLDPGDGQVCFRYREWLPMRTALKRLHRTYIIGLAHPVPGHRAQCCHIRRVFAPTPREPEALARHRAVLVAMAQVHTERHHRCGASTANLSPYVIERAADWQA